MSLDDIKQIIFGTNVEPLASRSPLLEVIFWPDAFLLFSFALSILLVVAISFFSQKITSLKIKSNATSVSAVFIARFVCFVILVGSISATSRIFLFIFGESTEILANKAAVTIFSILFLIPAFICAFLAVACGVAMHFLLSLKLQK